MTGALAKLGALVRLGRPHFLVGGVAFYGLGAAVAARTHPIDVRAYLWGQAAITATQLMTHYANDYFDLAADVANTTSTSWSGGSRVLPRGELPPRVAFVAAVALAVLALALDACIAIRVPRGADAMPVLLSALAASWGYSAPPFRLHTRGLGAPTVALVVTLLTPMAGYVLQTGDSLVPLLVTVTPLACAQVAMILVIDFPDAAGDAASAKRTPAVRFGVSRASRACVGLVCAPYVLVPFLLTAGLPTRAGLAVWATSPLAAVLVHALARGDAARASRWRRLTWVGVAWFGLLAGFQLAAALWIASAR